MRRLLLSCIAAGVLSAQSVGGPVLGYVVDAKSRLRPVYGMAAAGHVGAPVREGVRDTRGDLVLLQDGIAMRAGVALEGRWASVEPGALVDASRREVLVAGEKVAPWRLALPAALVSLSVSASGERVATVLADDSVAVWSVGGKADFRVPASQWWAVAFAGERALAYDPAANALLWLDGPAGASLLRQLDGPGGQYALAVDRAGQYAILLGDRLRIVPTGEGAVRTLTPPEGAQRLEPVLGGKSFLLTHNPEQPMWMLDPERTDGLWVIPAVAAEIGGKQ